MVVLNVTKHKYYTTSNSTPLLGEEQRLVVLAGDGKNDADDETCRTFIFKGETHTLANALRSAILQNPELALN